MVIPPLWRYVYWWRSPSRDSVCNGLLLILHAHANEIHSVASCSCLCSFVLGGGFVAHHFSGCPDSSGLCVGEQTRMEMNGKFETQRHGDHGARLERDAPCALGGSVFSIRPAPPKASRRSFDRWSTHQLSSRFLIGRTARVTGFVRKILNFAPPNCRTPVQIASPALRVSVCFAKSGRNFWFLAPVVAVQKEIPAEVGTTDWDGVLRGVKGCFPVIFRFV